MSNKSGQLKQEHKTTEQILAEERQKYEVERMKKVVKEKIYPLLVSETKSIEDARVFCSAVAVGIKQMYNSKMKELKLSVLELEKQLTPSPLKKRYEKMIEVLKDETVLNAVQIVEQIPQMIENLVRQEMSEKKLDELHLESL